MPREACSVGGGSWLGSGVPTAPGRKPALCLVSARHPRGRGRNPHGVCVPTSVCPCTGTGPALPAVASCLVPACPSGLSRHMVPMKEAGCPTCPAAPQQEQPNGQHCPTPGHTSGHLSRCHPTPWQDPSRQLSLLDDRTQNPMPLVRLYPTETLRVPVAQL